jgi:hypothetical protein
MDAEEELKRKERRAAHKKEYRLAHADHFRQVWREYRQKIENDPTYKERKRKYTLAWKAKNREKEQSYKKLYNAKVKVFWGENPKPQAPKLAEEIIIKKVLPKMGFTDQYKPIDRFYFDSLVKKQGQICAIEVTTMWHRTIDKMHIQILDYLRFPLYLFFVKPDLTCFYLIEREPLTKNKGFSYMRAQRFVFGKTYDEFSLVSSPTYGRTSTVDLSKLDSVF